jgi:hypothetical protein
LLGYAEKEAAAIPPTFFLAADAAVDELICREGLALFIFKFF